MRAATAVCAVVIVFLASSPRALTLRVPGNCATIQGAIDLATNGDTILVAPGSYGGTAAIVFDTKGNVRLVSEAGRAVTAIVGALELMNSNKIVVSGFTIAGGVGIICSGGTVVRDCAISNSTGSGIVITHCPAGAYSDATIVGNIIHDSFTHGVEGDLSGGEAAISGNEISGNGASGISITHSYCHISSNVIRDNGANGISVSLCTAFILRNTIVRNAGAGVRFATGGSAFDERISGSIVALNRASGLSGEPGGTYFVACCDVWGNGAPAGLDYAGAIADQTGTGGNISADPLFCSPSSNDFSLLIGSPALAQSCGEMGAFTEITCERPEATRTTTWGRIKTPYR
ncbi:MAG TPA: right-handed parallel beta-helix repeat-containing protein [Candidatus Bathyarchaeia archaeon]|nr:right-handed parallel beta-helix repeat-containing protein [Candidatus Bathyarchaeia archaeon]